MSLERRKHADSTSSADPLLCRSLRAVTEGVDGDDVDGVDGDSSGALKSEPEFGFLEAVRLYPKAVAWSVFFSIGVIMLAFDPQLLGNLYAMPAFRRDFGSVYKGVYIIPSIWQSTLSLGNPLGQCFGALFAAIPMDRFGRKLTFIACVVLTTLLIFVQFFATNLKTLLVGELLGGLVLGAYVVIAPAYASEVCPLALRGVLTSWTNVCFVLGQLLANGVTAWTQAWEGRWAYRVPFACQWIWCAMIVPGMVFAPESPWWLVRQGREQEAELSLRKLSSKRVDVKAALEKIVQTDGLENTQATYSDCVINEGGNRRRTEICVGVYAIQALSGIFLVNFCTLFFEQTGLDPEQAFDMGVGFLGAGLIAGVLNWFVMGYAGRRKIYVSGVAVLAALQLFIGLLGCLPNDGSSKTVAWAQCALMLAWNFTYNLTIGPICFVIMCEVSATRVRAKTIAVATVVQALLGIIMTLLIPYAMNPDGADLRGKMGFLWALLAAMSWAWAYRTIPETRNKTFEQLDLLFEHGVETKKFADCDVVFALTDNLYT